MSESTVTIGFPIRMADDKTGFTYVAHDHLDGASVYAGSIATAKAKLRKVVREQIDAALRQVAEYRQRFIGCGDGTVLLVQFRYGNWGYEIAGPGRSYHSGACCSTGDSFDHAVEAAKRHAAESSGVAWEC